MKGSLRRRLPAAIAALLTVSVVVHSAIAYSAARESTLRSRRQTLEEVARHMGRVATEGVPRRLPRLRNDAANPILAKYLISHDSSDVEAVLAVLRRAGRLIDSPGAVVLRDTDGRPLITSVDSGRTIASSEAPMLTRYDSAAVGPAYALGDQLAVELGAPVVHEGTIVGSLVVIRPIVQTDTTTLEAILRFIDRDARMYIGSADGTVWSDLRSRVDPLPSDINRAAYVRDGERRIGSAVAVEGTPFQVAVDIPEESVLTPVLFMLPRFALIALIIIGAGALAGWALSRRITDPLVRLTSAVESVTSGLHQAEIDKQVQIGRGRRDEIGVLSRSFAAMAENVRDSREGLEREVSERTAELRSALTQLQETQEELVRKERMATLGQLASSVGHELRNPLGVMTNATYLLEHSVKDATPKVREYINMLRAQIALSEKIVADLLDYARVRKPERKDMHVSQLIDAQLERVQIPPSIHIQRDIPSTTPLVNVDPVQIGQVLLNLVTNAVQSMEGAERATLLLRARSDGGRVFVDVCDTGPGIRPEHLDKVFEPLFTTKARGIGLGLSVSRALAQANSGDIVATNRDGGGATFTLSLPSAQS